jgi:hypothetical protein
MRADRTMYAVHPIPLSEVKAVRKHAPSFGTQHIVLVLTNGLTLPPLYFTAGGVRALFSALKEVLQLHHALAVVPLLHFNMMQCCELCYTLEGATSEI